MPIVLNRRVRLVVSSCSALARMAATRACSFASLTFFRLAEPLIFLDRLRDSVLSLSCNALCGLGPGIAGSCVEELPRRVYGRRRKVKVTPTF